MRHTQKVLPRCSVIATVVASALTFGANANSFTALPMEVGPSLMKQFNKNHQISAEKQFPTYYIVQLEDAALSTYSGGVKGYAPTARSVYGKDKLELQSTQAQAYQQYLVSRQQAMVSSLKTTFPGLQLQRSLQLTMNGLVVSVPGKVDIKTQLEAMPGVKKVYEHELFYTQMDSSNTLINSPELWTVLGGQNSAGEGVKVAIIDGGIRPEHPMFADNGHARPAGLPEDDYCATVDESFCNNKLVLARYYTPTFAVNESEYISPRDMGGHGTHVAGTAVGNPISGVYDNVAVDVSGVAPGATLMVYKALFQTPEGRGSGSNIMLVSALEDAIADGADVINNSWGGGAGGDPANSVYTPIFEAAEAAGVVVVTAAGNDGSGAMTIGCPGCAEPGITVASTQTGRTFGHLVDASGINDIVAIPGTGEFSITNDITALLVPTSEIAPSNIEGCSAFDAGSLTDKIVLLPRGTCAFSEKAVNAEAAGAVGMILYNNQPGVISMSMPGVTLPSVSILQEDGAEILAAWQAGDEATISKAQKLFNQAAVDAMSDFSSRGPNGNSSFLKPDIAAPGSDILSAAVAQDQTFATMSGTSMASPHVAGAAALLLQQRPELDARQIKSVLMTSSNPAVKLEDLETEATPFARGAGRLDVAAASKTAIAFDKASLVSNGCAFSCSFDRVVTNLMPEDGTWQGHVEFANDAISAELSVDELTLAANGTAGFSLKVNTAYAEAGWQFGQVVWTDTSGKYATAHLPVVVMAKRSDDSQAASTMLMSEDISAGLPFSIRSAGGHLGAREIVDFTVRIPQTAVLNTGSVEINETRATRNGFSIDPSGRSMSWAGAMTGVLASASLTNASFPGLGLSLVDLGLDDFSLPCEAGCDEVAFNYPIGNFGGFIWNGQQVNTITISDNGFITAAVQALEGSWQNQNLPAAASPNAVIAPLWADYAVGGTDGGSIFYNIVSDGTNDWFVWEWNEIQEYASSTGDRYTFSVWIKLGTDEVYMNYVNIPSTIVQSTVGIEDISGTLGTSRYYGGQGTAPVSEQALRALITPAQPASVQIDYDLVAPFGQAEAISTAVVRGESVEIDVSERFSKQATLLSHVTTRTSTQTFEATQPLTVTAMGNAFKAKVVNAPKHGTVTFGTPDDTGSSAAALTMIYTPGPVAVDAEAFTSDSFTYQIEDEVGGTSTEASVTIAVEEPNTAPVAVASATPVRAHAAALVTLSAVASTDAEGDELSFSWRQTFGQTVSLRNSNTAAASFTAPRLSSDAVLTFEVSVSDGKLTSTTTTSVTVMKESKGGGSLGWFTLLMLPLLLLRRKRA